MGTRAAADAGKDAEKLRSRSRQSRKRLRLRTWVSVDNARLECVLRQGLKGVISVLEKERVCGERMEKLMRERSWPELEAPSRGTSDRPVRRIRGAAIGRLNQSRQRAYRGAY